MEKKSGKFLFWAPRIIAIVILGFLFVLSLDVFEPDLPIGQIMMGLLIHNIPTLVLLGVLIISWKHESVGGIVFILAGILYVVVTGRSEDEWYTALLWSLIIAGPAFLAGILFLLGWLKRKHKINH